MILRKLTKDKRGISIMIGYILLITMAVIMSLIVYQWVKTYVPKDVQKCPDDVSLLIEEFNCEELSISLILRNNGLFNIDGYFVMATTQDDQELATVNLIKDDLGHVTFVDPLEPGVVSVPKNIPVDENEIDELHSIEIIPARYQLDDKKVLRLVSCVDAKIREVIPPCSIGQE